MFKFSKLFLLIFFLFSGVFFIFGYVYASGNISGYAWSENIGWINFGCDSCNANVADSALSGNAWSDNYGWINLSPANGGVVNNGAGKLSGNAWGQEAGWISFQGTDPHNTAYQVSINPFSGNFTGSAYGSITGSVSFNCIHCNVVTTWRASIGTGILLNPTPTPTPTPQSSGVGGSNSYNLLNLSPTPQPKISPTPTPKNPVKTSPQYVFTKKIQLGAVGPEVKFLQQYLNAQGFLLAQTGPGSAGKETEMFGPLTKQAVVKFQEKYASEILTPLGLKKGTGVVASYTIAELNKLNK